MKLTPLVFAVFVAVLAMASQVVHAQDGAPAHAARAQQVGAGLAVRPGALRGRVVDPADLSPVSSATVTLETPKGATIRTAQTDPTGAFDLGAVAAGDYVIHVGDAAGTLTVGEDAPAGDLTLIIPPPVARGARSAGAIARLLGSHESGSRTLALSTPVVIAGIAGGIGVAAGAGVGIAYATGAFDSGRRSSNVPSPSHP